MLQITYQKQFKKELEVASKRGKDTEKLKKIIEMLISEKPLLIVACPATCPPKPWRSRVRPLVALIWYLLKIHSIKFVLAFSKAGS